MVAADRSSSYAESSPQVVASASTEWKAFMAVKMFPTKWQLAGEIHSDTTFVSGEKKKKRVVTSLQNVVLRISFTSILFVALVVSQHVISDASVSADQSLSRKEEVFSVHSK